MPSSPPDAKTAAENAATAIMNACRELQNGLGDVPPLNFNNLLFEFKRNTGAALDILENYGTEKYFAGTVEWFITAANSWNKHIYSLLREGIGEVRSDNGNDKSNIKIAVYTWNFPEGQFTQELDEFEESMTFFESSPLRSLQSMQYIVEYYQALLTELQSSFSFVSRSVGAYDGRRVYNKRLDDVEYKVRQLEFGYETDGAAWAEQRCLSDAAVQWRAEEIRTELKREEERKLAERIQEEQRLEAKRVKEEEARRAKEEWERKEKEERRLRAMQEARERDLQEARIANVNLRTKIRNESQRFGALLEYEGWESTSDSISAVEPWAIFYEDDQIPNLMSAILEVQQSQKPSAWDQDQVEERSQQRESPGGTIHVK